MDRLDAFRATAGDRELLYSESGDGRWLHVMGDRETFAWALGEILANIETHAGGWSRVTVKAEPVRGGVLLTVRDDGPGLEPDRLVVLFHPFAAGPRASGAGLGLFTVREIVESWGGRIEARTAPGAGLLLRILLRHPPEGPYGTATAPPAHSLTERGLR